MKHFVFTLTLITLISSCSSDKRYKVETNDYAISTDSLNYINELTSSYGPIFDWDSLPPYFSYEFSEYLYKNSKVNNPEIIDIYQLQSQYHIILNLNRRDYFDNKITKSNKEYTFDLIIDKPSIQIIEKFYNHSIFKKAESHLIFLVNISSIKKIKYDDSDFDINIAKYVASGNVIGIIENSYNSSIPK
jgi:hypothetical protein